MSWVFISEILWYSPESSYPASAQTILYTEFESCTFQITATSNRGQWVKQQCYIFFAQGYTFSVYVVYGSTMSADALAPHAARLSAAMVLAMQYQWVVYLEGLQLLGTLLLTWFNFITRLYK